VLVTNLHQLIACFLWLIVFLEMHKTGGSGLAPWPARLTTPPPRLADFKITAEMFEKDTVHYMHILQCL
jgi:hypothetical protein